MADVIQRRSVWIFLFTVLGVGVTASLGFWQLRRADAKQHMHDARMARQLLPALNNADLACRADNWLSLEERSAHLTGRWLHEHTVVLDNRTMAGRTGFLVLTPLQLLPSPTSQGCAGEVSILVQRGWLPRDAHDRLRIPTIAQPQGLVSVPVRLTFAPSKMLALAFNAPTEKGLLRQNVDQAALSAEWHLPLLPGSAQQMADEAGTTVEKPLPVGMMRQWWQPQADVSKHQGYAAQWFLMAITMLGLYGWFQWWRPRQSKTEQ